MKFRSGRTAPRRTTIAGIGIGIFLILLLASAFLVHRIYNNNLRPVSNERKSYVVTIEPGSTTAEVATLLHTKGIIRSDWAFEWYVRNHGLRDELKAGTYLVYENQAVPEVVDVLVTGKIATDLVTILPAQRLDQIRESLINKYNFKPADVDAALDPAQYADHPALVDKPETASLEGYLYPESFQKTAETNPKEIIRLSLNEMQLRLTPEVRQAFSKQGLTVHQAITLASVIEQEVGDKNEGDRAQVAQVFLKRYKSGMELGSDVTAFYGAAINQKEPSVAYDSPYNTRLHPGLPPGPIGNVSESSLSALAFPAQTDWLYFVAGDDGKTYFSKTLEEHQDLTKKHCTKLCQ